MSTIKVVSMGIGQMSPVGKAKIMETKKQVVDRLIKHGRVKPPIIPTPMGQGRMHLLKSSA